jgi:hypothetical protein
VPEHVLGIYQWHSHRVDTTYLRFAFCGRVTDHDPSRVLDQGILRADWFSVEEITEAVQRHRSPLVMQCILDHIEGKRYPLALLHHYGA